MTLYQVIDRRRSRRDIIDLCDSLILTEITQLIYLLYPLPPQLSAVLPDKRLPATFLCCFRARAIHLALVSDQGAFLSEIGRLCAVWAW
jgi:hypothetical protein